MLDNKYQVTHNMVARDTEDLIWVGFYKDHFTTSSARILRQYSWAYDNRNTPDLVDLVSWEDISVSNESKDEAFNVSAVQGWYRFPNSESTVLVFKSARGLSLYISSYLNADTEKIVSWWLERYPRLNTDAGAKHIWMEFWSKNTTGPTSVKRRIDVPTWEEIKVNYSQPVQDKYEELRDMKFNASTSGKMIIWHGPPGTGKTYALRSLFSEWRKWCDFNYFVYPEEFFHGTDYMLQAILRNSNPYDFDPDDEDSNEKWRLLVFEDCGEFIAAGAKQSQGQGLSRLLNLADGIIGQGLKLIILITTNEKIATFDPAIKRGGRSSSIIPFSPLEENEIDKWEKHHGLVVPRRQNKMVLADLYNESVDGKIKAPVGFAS